MKTFLASIIAVTFMVASAEARRDQGREHRQQNRIKQGVQNGSVTKREAKKLRKGQKHIDKMQRKAMADGEVSDKEKARLEKAQDRQSKKIYNQKHDDQNRNDNAATPAVPANPNGPGTPATPAVPAVPAEGNSNN